MLAPMGEGRDDGEKGGSAISEPGEHIAMPRARTTSSHRAAVSLSRRAVVAGSVGAAALQAAAPLEAAVFDSAADELFMRLAIAEARRADLAFGAVIVRDGHILARGRNLGRTEGDPTAHGEMVAIRHCLAAHGKDALKGARSTPRASPARCASARSCGAVSAG